MWICRDWYRMAPPSCLCCLIRSKEIIYIQIHDRKNSFWPSEKKIEKDLHLLKNLSIFKRIWWHTVIKWVICPFLYLLMGSPSPWPHHGGSVLPHPLTVGLDIWLALAKGSCVEMRVCQSPACALRILSQFHLSYCASAPPQVEATPPTQGPGINTWSSPCGTGSLTLGQKAELCPGEPTPADPQIHEKKWCRFKPLKFKIVCYTAL